MDAHFFESTERLMGAARKDGATSYRKAGVRIERIFPAAEKTSDS
ncbi:MAG: hypothetical protein JWO30_3138, partial [Fibrobacteres bacterium]|nr:hypothetical protein [Fibrobacterota bacterium]